MFGKTKQKNSEAAATFIEVRSYYGAGIHIATSGADAPLCGYDSGIWTSSTTDAQQVRDSVPNQHAGWYWCPTCAGEATGMTADEIRAGRNG